MTEAEWLACANLERMLKFLHATSSARKLRLFACACYRWIWHELDSDPGQKAVEFAERLVDDLPIPDDPYFPASAAAKIGAQFIADAADPMCRRLWTPSAAEIPR